MPRSEPWRKQSLIARETQCHWKRSHWHYLRRATASRDRLGPADPKAATDKNGAFSMSFMTWFLFLLAHLSIVASARGLGVGGLLRDQRRKLRSRFDDRVLEMARVNLADLRESGRRGCDASDPELTP